MYRTVQIASDPRMPIGMSRFGLRVSSAAVATMSKPMKAKNTSAAPVKMPPTPNVLVFCPSRVWISGVVSRPAPASGLPAGGTNGSQLLVLM